MSEKTLRMSLYCLGAVVALYALIALAGGRDAPSLDDGGIGPALDGLDGALLTRIDLRGPEDTIRLEREGTDWRVNGLEADTGAVQRLLRAIDDVSVSSVAAANPANHARMGVDADGAWTLTADDVSVLLGNAGVRYRTAYARMPDADPVVLLEGDLRSAAARPLFDWRDKIVASVDTARIASVRVTHGRSATLFERGDSAWTAGGEEADASTVRSLLQELAGLRANGFADEGVAMPASPDRTVQAMDESGAELATLTLAEGDGHFLVVAGEGGTVFEIPNFRADRVAPVPEE